MPFLNCKASALSMTITKPTDGKLKILSILILAMQHIAGYIM